MSRREKMIRRMRENPADDWRADQLASILQYYGFELLNQRGSHQTWAAPSGRRVHIVDPGSSGVLPVYVKNVLEAIDEMKGEES